MDLTFYGAAREVTGSCYLIQANGKKLLVDCGLQQGQDEKSMQELPFPAGEIDFAVLTHAHIDHSGRLPLLVREGFRGKIYATRATCDLIPVMLRDSAHIQEMDALWENRKGTRAGREKIVPLYTVRDAENTVSHLSPCNYNETEEIAPGIKIRFVDAGHILGSASVEISLSEGPESKTVVFSGDIGNTDQPIIRDPQYIRQADYVVMESTYGDRNHEENGDYVRELAKIIDRTLAGGGNVVIPSFAVGRTQELLYFIREIKEKGYVPRDPDFPVYVDSPLAAEITKIYDGDLSGYGDEQVTAILKKGIDPLSFPNLTLIESPDESKALNFDATPKVIISSSGMCEAGRIRHHLKHNLWRKECAVVFVGYQANGTLGRILLDGVKKVKLFGEEIAVAASIYNFTGLSAHADRDGLIKWISGFTRRPGKVFVVHGEENVTGLFVNTLKELGYRAEAPLYKSVYDLKNGELVSYGVAAEKKTYYPEKGRAVSFAYARLLDAYQRLAEAVRHNEGGANRDLEHFTDEILKLAKTWDR